MSRTLEFLPIEIQLLIMKSMPKLQDLHTLLRSSPHFLQVYLHNQGPILSHVACNHITPALLPIAIMALEQHRCRGSMLARDAVLAFLEDFPGNESAAMPNCLFSLETSKALLQFHLCVEHFIMDFSESRLQIIETYCKNFVKPRSPPLAFRKIKPYVIHAIPSGLAPVEYHRIARAFYRMDIYGHLFHRELLDSSPSFTSAEQAACFLQKFKEWELEEFLCVRSYLVEKLIVFLNQVEDDCMDNFHVNARYQTERTENGRWDNEDYFFSKVAFSQRSIRWVEGCLTRGLRKINAMLAANTFSKRLIAIGDPQWTSSGLFEAMYGIHKYPQLGKNTQHIMSQCKDVCVDDIDSYSSGWLWSWKKLRKCVWTGNLWDEKSAAGNRRWGYCMWSLERLGNLRVLIKHTMHVGPSCYDILRVEGNPVSVESRTRDVEQLWDALGQVHPERRGVRSTGWLQPSHAGSGGIAPPNYK